MSDLKIFQLSANQVKELPVSSMALEKSSLTVTRRNLPLQVKRRWRLSF